MLAIQSHAKSLASISLWLPSVSVNAGSQDGEKNRQVLTGSNAPFKSRDIANMRYGFRLPITSTNYTLLGWVDNSGWSAPALMPLVLQSPEIFYDDSHVAQGVMVAFYAIMLTQLVYNMGLFLSLRDPLYGVYSLGVISAMLCCAVIDGSTLHWIFPDNPDEHNRILRVNSMLFMICNVVFVWMSLNRLRFSHRLQKGFQMLIILGCVGLFHSSITNDSQWASTISMSYYVLAYSFIFIVSIIAMNKRQPIAGYLLLAELLLILGNILFIQMNNGNLPFHPVTLWGAHWGYVVETILLSLILAARTRNLQKSAINNLKKFEILFEDSFEGRFVYSLENSAVRFNYAFSKLLGYETPLFLEQAIKKSSIFEGDRVMALALTGKEEFDNYELEWDNNLIDEKIWVSFDYIDNMPQISNSLDLGVNSIGKN